MCQEPSLVEKTSLYPFGYGFCQCGCGKLTRVNFEPTWASLLDRHPRPGSTVPARSPTDDAGENSDRKPRKILLTKNDSTSSVHTEFAEVGKESLSASPQESCLIADAKLTSPSGKYIYPIRGLLDAHIELSRKYGQLQDKLESLKLEISYAVKLSEKFRIDSGEAVSLLAEKLELVLTHFPVPK